MRLILRDDPADPGGPFHLAASDALGRPLWALAATGERVVLVDHRTRAVCSAQGTISLPEAPLGGLPPSVLPRVLRGRLPVFDEGLPANGEVDYLDANGRRWTARLEAGEPSSWTLWEGGRPLLWWLGQESGGVLSHRAGSQFRWRLSVEEARSGEFVLDAPRDYHRADCAGWDLP